MGPSTDPCGTTQYISFKYLWISSVKYVFFPHISINPIFVSRLFFVCVGQQIAKLDNQSKVMCTVLHPSNPDIFLCGGYSPVVKAWDSRSCKVRLINLPTVYHFYWPWFTDCCLTFINPRHVGFQHKPHDHSSLLPYVLWALVQYKQSISHLTWCNDLHYICS